MSEITEGHWKLNFNYKYLGSQDLTVYAPNGKDLIVKILSFNKELVEGENGKKDNCVVAELCLVDGTKIKSMIINKTNFKAMATAFKSENVKDYIGKHVAIFAKPNVWNGSERVTALRLREVAPKITLKEITESEYERAAIQYNTEGNLDLVKKHRTISAEQETAIIELSKTLKVE